MREPVDWDADGCPLSPRFDDIYRSRTGGWQQAQAVFLAGCGLPQAWRGRAEFTVLESGFGLGLNFLATWDAWVRDTHACGTLHYLGIEAFPVAADDIRRSAAALTALTATSPVADPARLDALAQTLADAWAGLRPGVQTLELADARLRLTLAVGDVQAMLAALDAPADAIYLDGFSPQRNPRMWSQDTLDALARHARAGTRLATYSTAPEVRQRLQQAGFAVRRCRGLPPKRRRLEACWGSHPAGADSIV